MLRRASSLVMLVAATAACTSGPPSGPDRTPRSESTSQSASEAASHAPEGSVYYSSADALMRYEVGTGAETVVFEGGDSFTVAPARGKFAWVDTDFFADSTAVHVHELATPAEATTIELAGILESSPEFAPGEDLLGALARSGDSPDTRTDLVLFDEQGAVIGRIPRVKDFGFSPNGKDVLISAEALDGDGEPSGWAVALVRDFRGDDQQTVTIGEYAGYGQLPTDLAVAPSSTEAVYTHRDHLFTVPLQPSATPRQVTRSRFTEIDAAWSPDGEELVFVATADGVSDVGCGELRIVTARPATPVDVPEAAWDDAPADPGQPVDGDGKVIHACDAESLYWVR